MEKFDILRDIAERTGGDIYIGVVGAARVGKSTFIRKFMELLVLPNIADPHEKQRAKDALPQAAGGRTIMTVEPKFVPDEGTEITLKDNISMRVRMVDCTGYVVPGALGYEEESGPRMVSTPWFEEPIPFEDAAEVGTRKVILDHSTIGLVVTTDGSITDIPRENYIEAEERVVRELKALGKPFIILLNSMDPFSESTQTLTAELEAKYDVSVIPVDCSELSLNDINVILEQVLYEFPVSEVNINLPSWVEKVDSNHWYRSKVEQMVKDVVSGVKS